MTDEEERIVLARISGRSVHAIAKSEKTTTAEVNRVLRVWTEQAIVHDARKSALALELAALDLLKQRFFAQAMQGDIQSAALVTKLIERRCAILGLHTPVPQTLQIIDASTPKQTNTDRIEAALNALLEDQRGKANGGQPN